MKNLFKKHLFKNKTKTKTRTTRQIYPNTRSEKNVLLPYYKKTFPNQKELGKSIARAFLNLRLISGFVVAPTQSGKTGTMVSLIYELCEHSMLSLPLEHVFLFTPISSKDWVQQTKERLPPCVNVFHRNHISTLCARAKHLNNILLIIDETHIAAKPHQTLHNLFDELGLYDIDHCLARNIKIVHFTATPSNLEQHFSDLWKEHGRIFRMQVPSSYVSFDQLVQEKRVFPARPYDDQAVQELRPFLQHDPAYHIIRTPSGVKHLEIIQLFKAQLHDIDAVFISEPQSHHHLDFYLRRKPTKHTFIFIKEKLRCAKTICHRFLGVLYERHVNRPISHVHIQGLPGRVTGYHRNKQAIVFANYHHRPHVFARSFLYINSID